MKRRVNDKISKMVEIEFSTGLMPRLNILQMIIGIVLWGPMTK